VRRYTAECTAFILQKVRTKADTLSLTRMIFALGTGLGGEQGSDWIEDFQANLLFLLLRGEQGSISHTGIDLTEFIAELVSGKTHSSAHSQDQKSFFLKTFNMLIENEYKFFKARGRGQSQSVEKPVLLEDYLQSIYQLYPRSHTLHQNMLSILTEILLFGSGQRFTSSLLTLSSSIIQSTRQPADLLTYSLPFLAKYSAVSHSAHPQLSSLPVLSPQQLYLFYCHLYLRNTFERTVIFNRFKDKYRQTVQGDISTPSIDTDCAQQIIVITMQSLEHPPSAMSADIPILCECLMLFTHLVQKSIEGGRVNIPSGLYSLLPKWIDEACTDLSPNTVDLFMGSTQLLSISSTLSPSTVSSIIACINGLASRVCIPSPQSGQYPQTVHYPLTSSTLPVLYLCTLVSILLDYISQQSRGHSPRGKIIPVPSVFTIPVSTVTPLPLMCSLQPIVLGMLSVPANHTAVGIVMERFHRLSLQLHRQGENIPWLDSMDKWTLSPALDQRLHEYLLSDVPQCRNSMLRVLLPPTSPLLTALVDINSRPVEFSEERHIHLLLSQVETANHYGQYGEEETAVLYYHSIGLVSHRLSTLQSVLTSIISTLLYRGQGNMSILTQRIIQATRPDDGDNDENSDTLTGGNRWVGTLIASPWDTVDYTVLAQRLMKILGGVLGAKGRDIQGKDKQTVQSKGSGKTPVPVQSSKSTVPLDEGVYALSTKWTENACTLLEGILRESVQGDIIPSLSTLFGERKEGIDNPEEIAMALMANTVQDMDREARKGERARIVQRMLGMIKAIGESIALNRLPEECKDRMEGYLTHILRYPSEEMQASTLQILLSMRGDSIILRQYGPVLRSLVSGENGKEGILRVGESIRSLTSAERTEVQSIVINILYRRMVEKRGMANRRQHTGMREYVIDTVGSLGEGSVDRLIEMMASTQGLDGEKIFTPHTRVHRVNAYLEMLENALGRVGGSLSEQTFMRVLQGVMVCIRVGTDTIKGIENRAKEILGKGVKETIEDADNDVDSDNNDRGEIDNGQIDNELDNREDTENNEDTHIQQEDTPASGLSLEDRSTIHLYNQLKEMRVSALKRLLQMESVRVDMDYSRYNAEILEMNRDALENMGNQGMGVMPVGLRILGLWCECEYYKGEFTRHPWIFTVLTGILANPDCAAKIYADVMELILKLEMFGLSEDIVDSDDPMSIEQYELRGDERISLVGKSIIQANTTALVESLSLLVQRLEDKKLTRVRPSDQKNLNKRISEFSLFLSRYCGEGEDTLRFYEVTSKAWNVDAINKKTAKPFNKIDTAQELMAVQRESEAAANMLRVLANFCKSLPDTEGLFNDQILPLVSKLEDKKLRINLQACLEGLMENPNFGKLKIRKEFIKKLSMLHKLNPSVVRPTLDHNRIVDTLLELGEVFTSLPPMETRLLIAHCMYLISSDDLSTRDKSYSLISSYISGSVYDEDYRVHILSPILHYLGSPFSQETTLRYHSLLIRDHTVHVHTLGLVDADFYDLHPLCSPENKEKDYFDTVFSVKVAARGQAVKILGKTVKKGHIYSPQSVKRVLTRIFDYYLYEVWRQARSEKNAYSVQRIDTIRNIMAGIIEVYGKIVGMLPFTAFVRFVKDKIFQLEGKGEDYIETSMRVVCSCLNHLPSSLPNVLAKVQKEQETLNDTQQAGSLVSRFVQAYADSQFLSKAREEYERPQALREESENNPLDGEEGEDEEPEDLDALILTPSQYRVLKLHVLGPLKRHLLKKDEKETSKYAVRQEVALGILQLAKVFPLQAFNSELVGTLSKVCEVLRDRDEDRRKTARNTLVSMLRILGPFFLGFFIKELSFHLTRGYEAHIRNYTIFKLLEVLVKPPESMQTIPSAPALRCGQIDYCLSSVYPLLLSEVCGELEEEKDVQEIKNKSIEFKKNRANECFRMIASKIIVSGSALPEMVKAWHSVFLKGNMLVNILGKMNELGQHVISGLMSNPTVSTEAVIILVKTLSDQASKSIRLARTESDVDIRPEGDSGKFQTTAQKHQNTYKVQEGAGQGQSIFKIKAEKKIGRQEILGQFLAVFAMRLFQRCLKMNKISIAQESKEDRRKSSEMLDPIVTHVVDFLGSTNTDLMQSSLEIVGHILHWPVYCVRKNNRKMLRLILGVLESSESSDLNLIQSCFKMIRRILKANRYFLSAGQMTEVVRAIRENMYPADWVNEPLHCLNLLITLRIIKPEMYDAFEDAFALMISTKFEPIRRLLTDIVLNFIQNFPLSEQLLEKIVMRLVNNLDYAEKEGRKVVIEVFGTLYSKLPLEALKTHHEMVVFGFTTRLVNEEVAEVKTAAEGVLRTILEKMHDDNDYSHLVNKLFDNCTVWLQNEGEDTRRAGLQLLRLLFSVTGDYSRVETTLTEVISHLEAISDRVVQFWEELKMNEQLGEILKNNRWKDVFFDEASMPRDTAMVEVKNTKNLVMDYLAFLSPLLSHQRTKDASRNSIFRVVLALSRHPDEDVQVEVLRLAKDFINSPHSKGAVSHNLKSLLLALFAAAKSKHLTEQIIPTLTSIVDRLLGMQGESVPKLRQTLLTAISAITFKYLKFGQKYSSIVSKCLSLGRSICQTITSTLSEEELFTALSFWLRLGENGWVKEQKELLETIESVDSELTIGCRVPPSACSERGHLHAAVHEDQRRDTGQEG